MLFTFLGGEMLPVHSSFKKETICIEFYVIIDVIFRICLRPLLLTNHISIFLNVLSRVKGVFDSISLMASEIMRRMTYQSKLLKKRRKLS